MMGLKGKLGTALLSASMLGMLIGTPVQAASSVSGKINSSTCSGSVSYAYAPGGACNGIQAKTIFGNVYGGTGWHYIKSGAYTWENNTKIGTTW